MEQKINCFILSFNRLTYLRELVDILSREPRLNLIIVDNFSTYKPLRNYLYTIKDSIRVIRLVENYGHTVVWKLGISKQLSKDQDYIVTDCDTHPTRPDFLDLLLAGLNKYPDINKVGLGLRTNNLPRRIPFRKDIIRHENHDLYRKTIKKEARFVKTPVDTTFALYRGGYHKYSVWGHSLNSWDEEQGCRVLRTTHPWQAIHKSWYMTKKDLQTEEYKFYLESLKTDTHWSNLQKKLYETVS